MWKWGNLQGQETNSFDEAFIKFPSCWDLDAKSVKSKTATEIERNCQTNTKYRLSLCSLSVVYYYYVGYADYHYVVGCGDYDGFVIESFQLRGPHRSYTWYLSNSGHLDFVF